MKWIAACLVCVYLVAGSPIVRADDTEEIPAANEVVASPPSAGAASGPPTDCKQINTGGPIAGIVVASVFWAFLPMSIPVWITQAKKLKRRKAERYEQAKRGCPPQ